MKPVALMVHLQITGITQTPRIMHSGGVRALPGGLRPALFMVARTTHVLSVMLIYAYEGTQY